MSGGQLVVLDRSGAAVKVYMLSSGLVTLGSRAPADIRIMVPEVRPHHATIAVHNSQTVIRNTGGGETLVNGQSVTVAALKHKDVITIGDRDLRWEYSTPSRRQQVSLGLRNLPAVRGGARAAGGVRRASAGAAPPPPRDRDLQLAIEMSHRASMPASSGGKQVAIVQPQRRDNVERNVPPDTTQAILWIESRMSNPRRRTVPAGVSPGVGETDRRTPTPGVSSGRRTLPPSRRPLTPPARPRAPLPAAGGPARRALSARRSTPLRLTVLKRAQSATKMKVVKIEAPSKIDHTKQAAIMLMTGHTPRARLSLAQPREATPSYVVKKPSPVRKTPARKGRASGRGSASSGGDGVTPKRRSVYQEARRSSKRSCGNNSVVSIVDITDSDSQSAASSSRFSSTLPTPKKSALKDFSKKSARKTESIKFDLSNLENHQNDTTRYETEDSINDEDLTLQRSESSARSAPSPSPRRAQHSRSGRMLAQVGAGLTLSPSRTLTPTSPTSKKSARSSLMLQRALDGTDSDYTSTNRSGYVTGSTASPHHVFSMVDLISNDSDASEDRTKSIYNSVTSVNTTNFETPNASNRKSRSTIHPSLLGSSTPYASTRPTRSTSIPELSQRSTRSSGSARRSKSLSTPENRPVSALSAAPALRGTRSRSRINDTDLLLLDDTEDDSPKSSRRSRAKDATTDVSKANDTLVSEKGTSTPENRRSPVDAGTPVLNIQSFLDSSRSSNRLSARKGIKSRSTRRKTVGVPSAVKRRAAAKSKSLGATARRSILHHSFEFENQPEDAEDNVTPRGSVRLEQEAVKNRHSTAKKPQSRRSIIDDLERSDIVKQLFNSPVKRKLSRSMTEFERRYDDEDVVAKWPTRHTLATTGRSGDDSLSDISGTFTPDRFVSPISTPSHSPDLSGIQRLFRRTSPEDDPPHLRADRSLLRSHKTRNSSKNDISKGTGLELVFATSPRNRLISTPSHSPDLSGIQRLFRRTSPEDDPPHLRADRSLLRSHKTRNSSKNDISKGTGLELVFATSPRNRLSDVRVKEVFRRSPNNDLRRVSGVKSLFGKERSPKNDLSDVGGVRDLFRRSPADDLRNVSGVKRTLRNSPRNDLTDVRGVGRIFRHGTKKRSSHELSGVEELFNESSRSQSSEELFDRLVGKPTVRKVYSRTFCSRASAEPERRKGTFHVSLERIPDSVVAQARELKVRRRTPNVNLNITKEMQKLVTSTVDGEFPFLASRTRNSSLKKSASYSSFVAHALPIKKRSLASPRASPAAVPRLPLKKRAVLHSTPMKGRLNVTMNASELGRVSPIRAIDNTHVENASLARTTRQKTIPEAAIAKDGPSKGNTSQKLAKLSPKVSTSKAGPPASPKAKAAIRPKASPKKVQTPPKRATRNRKNTTTANTSKKGRPSLVISKKAPVMSPEAGARPSSPPRRAATRKQVQKPPTPAKRSPAKKTPAKRTRVAKAKVSVVVPEQSPKLKPQADKEASRSEDKPKRTRRNIHFESPKESQAKTRGKKNEFKGKENKSDNVSAEKPKRGRKPAVVEVQPSATRRGRGANTSAHSVNTRGKAVTETAKREKKVLETVELPTTRRGRNNTENVVKLQPKSGKKTEPPLEKVPKTRGKKIEVQSSTQPEPATRGRRAKADKENTVTSVPLLLENRRKRKTVPEDEIPAKVAKTVTRRGRKDPEPGPATTADKKPAAKPRATKDKGDPQQESKTRGKKVTFEEPAPAKATRGRKVAEPKENPVAEKRKRNTKEEASPVKGKKPSPSVSKKARQAEPAAAGRTRAQAAEGGASGRSRRRR